MQRQAVESSNIASIGYDEGAEILEVEYKGKAGSSVYQYFQVPVSVYQGLMAAGSKGEYLGAHVKGVYSYVKI